MSMYMEVDMKHAYFLDLMVESHRIPFGAADRVDQRASRRVNRTTYTDMCNEGFNHLPCNEIKMISKSTGSSPEFVSAM